VRFVRVSRRDEHTFFSGSCDKTVKFWDIRAQRCVQTHVGHDADVNAVKVLPGGYAFGTASDDSLCRLFDIRCWNKLRSFRSSLSKKSPMTSLDFSISGKLMFGGSDDSFMTVWDVLNGIEIPHPLQGHEKRIASMQVSHDGRALASASWDTTLAVWA